MKKNNLHLLNSNLKNKSKPIGFKLLVGDLGHTKYLPPVSKEWNNTIYSYYKNNMKDLAINNINANKIIRSYFDLHFKDPKFIDSSFLGRRKRRNIFRKIYTSKLETKHTNSKLIVTLYTMNIGNKFIVKKYKQYFHHINTKILKFWRQKLYRKIKRINLIKGQNLTKNKINLSFVNQNPKELFTLKYKLLSESVKWYNLYLKLYLSKIIKYSYYENLRLLRKLQYNYYLNKFKYEKEIFIPKLNNLLSRIYNKKNIEFNIINLKSLTLNTDFFTEALGLKMKRIETPVSKAMKSLLKKVYLPKVNRVIERSRDLRLLNLNAIGNTFKDLSLSTLLNLKTSKNSLTILLKEISKYSSESLNSSINKDYVNISNLIFNSIKYKNLGGIRLELKGRLSKRYRADRAVYNVKWKGGLKDIDSSYKKLSTVTYRGHYKPNLSYSLYESKRHVGAFAVKGWIGGK